MTTPVAIQALSSLGQQALEDKRLQWTPSNPATLGTNQSVLIRGMASLQGGTCIEFVLAINFWEFSKLVNIYKNKW